MRIFGLDITLARRSAASSRPTSPLDDRWYMPFNFGSGGEIAVTPTTALSHPVVYACVDLIARTLAAMPLHLYQRKGDARERATNHPLYNLLRVLPNPRYTAIELREMLIGHMLLRGNAFAQILYRADGDIDSLWPLNPTRMEIEYAKDSSNYRYKYQLSDSTYRYFEPYEIWHLRGPSDGGLMGRSPLSLWAQTIRLGLSMAEYEERFYENSASPAGILSMPAGQKALSKEAKDRLRNDWEKKFSTGGDHYRHIAILEEGVTWQQIGMTSADAEFIAGEKEVDLKIARLFHVPPHKIGILDKATFNNIEAQGIDFYTSTLLPWAVRIEQSITKDLLRFERTPDKYFAEHMMNAVMRGDTTSRFGAYAVARQWGWMSVNDIRKAENENPIEGGDVYLQPLNMIDATQATDYLTKSDKSPTAQPAVKSPTDNPNNPTLQTKSAQNDANLTEIARICGFSSEKEAVLARFSRLSKSMQDALSDVLQRVMMKRAKAMASKQRTWDEIADFDREHVEFLRESVKASIELQVRTIAEPFELDVDAVTKMAIEEISTIYYSKYIGPEEGVARSAKELAGEALEIMQRLCWPWRKEEHV